MLERPPSHALGPKGSVSADALHATAAGLRHANRQQLAEAGIDDVPTGDFSCHDHVLDTTVMMGAIPGRHRAAVEADALDGHFAMARGTQDVAPLEMTKWFDTNYRQSPGRRAPRARPETRAPLESLVAAARTVREELSAS